MLIHVNKPEYDYAIVEKDGEYSVVYINPFIGGITNRLYRGIIKKMQKMNLKIAYFNFDDKL